MASSISHNISRAPFSGFTVCVGARRKASLNHCRGGGDCIAVLSPMVMEVAVLLVRTIELCL